MADHTVVVGASAGSAVSALCQTAVIGGRLLALAGVAGSVGHAAATGQRAIGVAGHDAAATEGVTVLSISGGVVYETDLTGAPVAVGDTLNQAANGTVAAAGTLRVGTATRASTPAGPGNVPPARVRWIPTAA
jgi:hypothetical protein